MVKGLKKMAAYVMTAAMIFSMTANESGLNTFAGEGLENCGENLSTQVGGGTYTLSIDVINPSVESGREIRSYYYGEDLDCFPWSNIRDDIEAIEIGDGVVKISQDAFRNMPLLETVTIPGTMYHIAKDAFINCDNLTDVYYMGNMSSWNELIERSKEAGFDFSKVTVHYEMGYGLSYENNNNVIILNTQTPLPGKKYEEVSCYPNVYNDKIPGYSYDSIYSTGVVTWVIGDDTYGMDVYERWTEYMMPENRSIETFKDNTRYNYIVVFYMGNSGLSDEEIKEIKIETPYVDWEYSETYYSEFYKLLCFKAYYLNGTDEYESENKGIAELDLRDGEQAIFNMSIEKDANYFYALGKYLEELEINGYIDSSSESGNTMFDLDKDGNYDMNIVYEYVDDIGYYKFYALNGENIKGDIIFKRSDEEITKAKCMQRYFGFFSGLIVRFDSYEEENNQGINTGDEEDADIDIAFTPKHKKGKKISDKKYIYKVTKPETLGVLQLPELEVVGLKKKSLKQVKIATEVIIDDVQYRVTSIAKDAFKGNKNITKATIGKNVEKIGNGAFSGCSKLKQVTINSKYLKNIGSNAFAKDKALKKLIIKSKKLKKVGKKALYRKGGKKLTIKVPKAKKKAYKKLFKKAKTNNFVVK